MLEDDVLDDLREALGGDVLAGLLDKLPVEILRQRCAMQSACERAAMDELRGAAHALKGSAGTLGALRLSALCLELETAAAASDAERARDALSAFEAAVLPCIAECLERSAAERRSA